MSTPVAAASVGTGTAVVALLVFVVVVALGAWTVRHVNRQFPKGFDRTGWNPERRDAGWFRTKFTWLSGGRG